MRLLLRCEFRCSVHIILKAIAAPLFISHSRSRSRGAFFAPGFCFLRFTHPIEGLAERRESSGACEAPVGPARNAAGQAPNEAPCVPYGGRPPPGAPPWRFWAPVPRFPHRQLP